MKIQFDYISTGLILLIILTIGFYILNKSDNFEKEPKNIFIEDNSGEYINNSYRSEVDTESSGLNEVDSEF